MLSADPTRVSQRAKKRGLPQVAYLAPLAHSSDHKHHDHLRLQALQLMDRAQREAVSVGKPRFTIRRKSAALSPHCKLMEPLLVRLSV